MSRSVIISDIMPIVERIFSKLGTDLPYGSIRDKKLIDFLDEQLSHRFRIAGQDEHCEQLEEQIKQAKQNDSKELENLIGKLLNQYINLRKTLDCAERNDVSPPDRFEEQRKKARKVWRAVNG